MVLIMLSTLSVSLAGLNKLMFAGTLQKVYSITVGLSF